MDLSQFYGDHHSLHSSTPNTTTMATTTTSHRLPNRPLDLEITIVSAKHLKNVNWKNGDLTPYAIFWLHPDRRLATKSDDSNSTKPVWNERFILPLPSSPAAASLNLEIFHSKPSDTPKPLVGSLCVQIDELPNPTDSTVIRTFNLRRPSGRPDGKIRLKLALRERTLPNHQISPQPAYYGRYPPYLYNPSPSFPPPPPPAAPSPPPPHAYHYGSYSDPYSGYYQRRYYSQETPRSFIDRPSTYGGEACISGPSAPINYVQYEQKQKTGMVTSSSGLGIGLAAGSVAGGLAGLEIGEGLMYEEENNDFNAWKLDDYSDFRSRHDY